MSTGGDRFSPKITVGVTPVAGFTPYVSYAEGYCAPSITETLIDGGHASGGGPAFFTCPDQHQRRACFLPNPNLRPEVGKNKEVGVNSKYDGIFAANDSFRGKFNIPATMSTIISIWFRRRRCPCPRSVRTASSISTRTSRMPVSRASRSRRCYDAGCGACRRRRSPDARQGHCHQCRARDHHAKVTTTAGVRLLDRTLILAVQWSSFGANNDMPAGYLPSTAYDLVNLYLT